MSLYDIRADIYKRLQEVSDNILEHDGALEATRPYLLALEKLHPGIAISALDLLDKGLVRRFAPLTEGDTSYSVYYIISSRTIAKGQHVTYETRPNAHHCSCPAFTIATFKRQARDAASDDVLCKHLLAALLAESAGKTFRRLVTDQKIGIDKLAKYSEQA